MKTETSRPICKHHSCRFVPSVDLDTIPLDFEVFSHVIATPFEAIFYSGCETKLWWRGPSWVWFTLRLCTTILGSCVVVWPNSAIHIISCSRWCVYGWCLCSWMAFHFAPDLAHCHCSLKLLLDIHCLVSASFLCGLNWMKKMCWFSMVKGCYLALDVYITSYALFIYK